MNPKRFGVMGKTGPLKDMLFQWTASFDRYFHWFDSRHFRANPYTERAIVGSVAAATWLKGGIALEEFTDRKHGKRDNGEVQRGSYRGRIDVLLRLGKSIFVIEAKRGRILFDNNDVQKALRRILADAEIDANKLPRDYGKKIAMAVVLPTLPMKARKESIIAATGKLIKQLQLLYRRKVFDVAAWYLPQQVRRVIPASRTHKDVGVLILFKHTNS